MRREKTQLLLLLQSIHFTNDPDYAFWRLDKIGIYSIHTLYKFLNSGGIHYSLTRSV
jgi:hypothetical protein